MIRLLSTAFLVFLSGFIFSQGRLSYHSSSLIVKFENGQNAISESPILRDGTASFQLIWEKEIYSKRNIHKYSVKSEKTIDLEKVIDELSLPFMEWASPDYQVERRRTPNDPDYFQQWNMDIIKAREAWDISTGGVTINGDTIVVAIIDSGFYLEHDDIKDNIWKNRDEIPNDGIDNDGNNFIDDYLGWNFIEDVKDHDFDSHGTAVAGIIGAKGDNGRGIAGVNWDIQYLLVTGVSFISNLIESYAYVLDQRTDYNESGGQKGAYVVVSNFSAGVPESFPTTNPAFQLWCNLYDDLGEQGIVSVGSTSNDNVDVDVFGDMPSTCGSPYLIIVTNTNSNDGKVTGSGFGSTHVDIGAPGASIYTVGSEGTDDYWTFPGTSASCPHVSGAVALIFSAPCQEFMDLYVSDPSAGALAMRQAIFDGADPLMALNGITTTGSRLNIFGSMEELRTYCSGTTGELEIINLFPNPIQSESLTIEYQAPDFGEYSLDVYNTMGQVVYTRKFSPPFFGDEKSLVINNIADWAQGIYYLRIQGEENRISAPFLKL